MQLYTTPQTPTIKPMKTYHKDSQLLTYNQITQPISAWADATGIPASTIHARIKQGWSAERTITTPNAERTYNYQVRGVEVSLKDAVSVLGITHQALYSAAKRKNSTPEEEMNRRFKDPNLFAQLLQTQNNKKD